MAIPRDRRPRALLLGVGLREGALSFKVLALLRGCSRALAAPSLAGRLPALQHLCPGVPLALAGAAGWARLLASPAARRGAAFLTADFPLWEEAGAAAASACERAGASLLIASSPSSLEARLSAARGAGTPPERWFAGFRVVRAAQGGAPPEETRPVVRIGDCLP